MISKHKDLLDAAALHTQAFTDNLVEGVREKAAKIKQGHSGECYFCGEQKPRVVWTHSPEERKEVEACAFCRDEMGLE